MPANSGAKQSGRFKKGHSGNPAGKRKGVRHATTLLAEKLMQDDAKNIVNAVLEAARAGDMTAAKIVLDRIAPARRDSPVSLALPKIKCPADAVAASAAVLAAVASGGLTPGEALDVSKLIDSFVKTIEVAELESRLNELEERMNK